MTSAEISIIASAVPDTLAAPTTTVNNYNVAFTWVAPYNGGSVISSYKIQIRHKDGTTFSVDSTNCDGS